MRIYRGSIRAFGRCGAPEPVFPQRLFTRDQPWRRV